MTTVTAPEKLVDYLKSFTEMTHAAFPIGAIIVDESGRDQVLRQADEEGCRVLTTDRHPGATLMALADGFGQERTIVLDVRGPLVPAILNQLSNLVHGVFDATLPGEQEPRVMSPLSKHTGLVLVLTQEAYDVFPLTGIFTSACKV